MASFGTRVCHAGWCINHGLYCDHSGSLPAGRYSGDSCPRLSRFSTGRAPFTVAIKYSSLVAAGITSFDCLRLIASDLRRLDLRCTAFEILLLTTLPGLNSSRVKELMILQYCSQQVMTFRWDLPFSPSIWTSTNAVALLVYSLQRSSIREAYKSFIFDMDSVRRRSLLLVSSAS